MNSFKELWDYRQMIVSLVKKDLTTRYKGSILGFLWTFINPLFQLLIYTIVFSYLLPGGGDIDNFAMYLFVALIPWLFCSSSIQQGSMSVIINAGLVQKVYFPRIVLPISAVTSNFVNMLLSFIVVFVALLVTGTVLTPFAFLLPIIMVIEYFFVMGIAILVSAATVYLRDLEHVLSIFVMGWFYLAPIVYSTQIFAGRNVPAWALAIIYGNPITGIVNGYRDVLLYGRMPDFAAMIPAFICIALFLVIGVLVFNKLQKRFAEEL